MYSNIDINDSIIKLQDALFKNFQSETNSQFEELLIQFSKEIAKFDFYQSSFYMKKQFALSRPEIVTLDDPNDQLLEIKNLRHLLVEHYNDDTEFITNDISLDSKKTTANLIYGKSFFKKYE